MQEASQKQGDIMRQALELTFTMDEALAYMDKQLAELRLEDFGPLFNDFLLAVAALADN